MNISGTVVDALIVGAGLSGAYAADRLLASNRSVVVVDARNRVGGRLLTAAAVKNDSSTSSQQGGSGSGNGDLGGAWIWPRSEYIMNKVLQDYNIKTVPMWLEGSVSARLHNGQQHVISDFAGNYAACGTGAVRISGGASTLVERLLLQQQEEEDDNDDPNHLSVQLGKRVTRIEYENESGVTTVHLSNKTTIPTTTTTTSSMPPEEEDEEEIEIIHCHTVILAAPPKVLMNTIEFVPSLPKEKRDSMYGTPTWMEEYGKVTISFPENWWRQNNMSAISIDQLGEVQTWWEACSGMDGDGSHPTLAGFVTSNGAEKLKKTMILRSSGVVNDVDDNKNNNNIKDDCCGDEFHEHILNAIMRIYGVDAKTMGIITDTTSTTTTTTLVGEDGIVVSKDGITVTYKSWKDDPYTNSQNPSNDEYGRNNMNFVSPTNYGNRNLQQSIGSLFFAGTETAHGSGHMEGAIVAAERVVDEVNLYLNEKKKVTKT